MDGARWPAVAVYGKRGRDADFVMSSAGRERTFLETANLRFLCASLRQHIQKVLVRPGRTSMPDAIDRAFRRAVRFYVFPNPMETERALSVAAIVFISATFVITALLAEPHLRDWSQANIWKVTCVPGEEKEHTKNLCDFVIILCQVLIALMVGGIAAQLVKASYA
jgi:hypothetical protein